AKIAAVAAAVLTASPAFAAPVSVTGAAPSASARIVKPLTLTASGSLNFGTIVMNSVSSNQSVNLAADGTLTCDAQLVCAPTGTVPTYNVAGTQGQTVSIIKNTSTLTGSNGGSLTLTPVGAATIVLANSGSPGSDFNIGGSLVIGATTIDGLYTGTVNVQVDYN
ncbi:MAG: DUF4402 domain-containing protein, partial [Sphingomicrobium sp.]